MVVIGLDCFEGPSDCDQRYWAAYPLRVTGKEGREAADSCSEAAECAPQNQSVFQMMTWRGCQGHPEGLEVLLITSKQRPIQNPPGNIGGHMQVSTAESRAQWD